MPESLPIDAVSGDLRKVLADQNRLVLSAPPGAGKTTRVPLVLIDEDWLGEQRILMLEPRRIAARSAAERLAHNLGEPVGQRVGYRIRGETKVSQATRIEVITEGILTRMLQSDPELSGIGAILFDEVHERSIHSDLGLALSLEVQAALREDLRLVAMSATIDVSRFSALMGDCQVVASKGQSFPVETHWLERPWRDREQRISHRQAFTRAAHALVQRAISETKDDVLVFLPGAGEIRALKAILGDSTSCRIATLFGAMPISEQRAVLNPAPALGRRVVLATAIAETSLTVPGVRVVVDTGLARRPYTDPATGMGRLQTVPVSMAEADQRRGRAGRLGPGTCYRMWTRGQEGSLERFAAPEILSADVTALALELAQWGVDDPATLAFLDPPRDSAMVAARALLSDLGALDARGGITPHGRNLVLQPLHPRLAHMITLAQMDGLGAEAALIASVLGARPGQLQRDVPGGDLGLVLQRCASGPATPAIRSIRDEAKRLTRDTGWDATRLAGAAPGLVASAYPDRVAIRRPGDQARFLLANGRGAVMDTDHPLSAERLVIATDLEDGREARIRTAIAIQERDLRTCFAERIHWQTSVEWSARHRRVEARRREMFGAIFLKDELWREAPPDQLGLALTDGIRQTGLSALNWTEKASRFRRRVAWANQMAGTDLFADLSDAALTNDLDKWLAPHLSGLRTIEAAFRLDMLSILKGLFDWNALQELERIAPDTFTTPAGSARPVDYSGEIPQVSVRIQEMYGTDTHPCLGVPPIPVQFNLLSPADRTVQTTADLPNFWKGSYADVRRDLRMQYPKHDWPENPAETPAQKRSVKTRRQVHTKS